PPRAPDRHDIRETCIRVGGPRVAGLRIADRRAERAIRIFNLDNVAALLGLRTDVAVRQAAAVDRRGAARARGAATGRTSAHASGPTARGSCHGAADAARILALMPAMKWKAAVQLCLVSAADRIA